MQHMRVPSVAGFSLVDVLVSLLLLSVGVLGAAYMQLAALRSTRQAVFHQLALQIASEAADHARTFPTAGANPWLGLDFSSGDAITAPARQCHGGGHCDAAELAGFAAYELKLRLVQALPQGRILICQDAFPWDAGTGRNSWNCDAAGGTAPLVVKLGWRDLADDHGTGNQNNAGPQLLLQVAS